MFSLSHILYMFSLLGTLINFGKSVGMMMPVGSDYEVTCKVETIHISIKPVYMTKKWEQDLQDLLRHIKRFMMKKGSENSTEYHQNDQVQKLGKHILTANIDDVSKKILLEDYHFYDDIIGGSFETESMIKKTGKNSEVNADKIIKYIHKSYNKRRLDNLEHDLRENNLGGPKRTDLFHHTTEDENGLHFVDMLEHINLKAEHVMTMNCYDVGNQNTTLNRLEIFLGNGFAIQLKNKSNLQNYQGNIINIGGTETQYQVKWNISNFFTSNIDLKRLSPYVPSFPFYLKLGGKQVEDAPSVFKYIRDYLLFPKGSTQEKIKISYNSTKWNYTLYAPDIGNHIAYRISVKDDVNTKHCSKILHADEKSLSIYCENHEEDAHHIGASTKLFFYTFGDQSDVPEIILESLISYNKLCRANATSGGQFVCFILRHQQFSITFYLMIAVIMQYLAYITLHNEKLKTTVVVVNLLTYFIFYCPSVIAASDIKQLVSLIYLFYLEPIDWQDNIHFFLAIVWFLYNGFLYVLGLVLATFLLADLHLYGHFHSIFMLRDCKSTCDKDTSRQQCYLDNKDAKTEKSPSNAYQVTCNMALEDLDLKKELPEYFKYKKINIISGAIIDILKLWHYSVYVYSLPCLIYYMMFGFFPIDTGLYICVGLLAFEIIYYFLSKIVMR